MAFRDQRRRPLVLILLLVVPACIVIYSVLTTRPSPHRIELPGGIWVMTTMKALHGPEMAKLSVAFVAALVGVFVMRSALQGDRRLVLAGLPASDAVLARLAVLVTAIAVAVVVAALAIAPNFTPASWPAVVTGLVLTGLMYGAIGALAGTLLDKLPAIYLILFLVLTDLSVVQTPMFHPRPSHWAILLPGYGPTRVMLDGAYAHSFHAAGELLIGIGWLFVLGLAVFAVLRRAVQARR
jgi:hypothetical protein